MLDLMSKITGCLTAAAAPLGRRLGEFVPTATAKGIRILSTDGTHTFCGYYDVSPFHCDKKYLLALRADQASISSPHATNSRADVGYYDLDLVEPRFYKIADTGCWNWQQGCRLQWLPADTNLIAYNDISSSGYRMIVREAFGDRIVNDIDAPFYALHEKESKTLSLNFARLHQYRRGYGYHNFPDAFAAELAPRNDGLWLVNLNDGRKELLVSYDELAAFEARPAMTGAAHYLNHLQWAPDGRTIIFFHQWVGTEGKKQGRLIILDPVGGLRELDPLLRPSHTAWSPTGKLLVTGHRKDSAAMYHLYDIASGQRFDCLPAIRQDGHPSFLTAEEIISDTYPDFFGRQTLYRQKLDPASPRDKLATFYVPAEYQGELRCDFHPRLSSSHQEIAIDIIHNSFRAVAVRSLK